MGRIHLIGTGLLLVKLARLQLPIVTCKISTTTSQSLNYIFIQRHSSDIRLGDFWATLKNSYICVKTINVATFWVTFEQLGLLFTPTSGHTGPDEWQ